MSSSEDEGEGKPLLRQREEITADDESWLSDSTPSVQVKQQRRPGLARLAMQSYDVAEELVRMSPLPNQPGSRRPSAASTNPRRTTIQSSSRAAVADEPVHSCFDDKSKMLYASLPERHKANSGHLLALISSTGNTLRADCSSQIRNMVPGFSYSDMMQYLLVSGETVLTTQGNHLVYSKIVLKNEKGEEYRKLPRGQAVITDKRLLFLSCEHMQKASLESLHGVGIEPVRYVLRAKEGDATVYVPVPLACLKGVELVSYTVASGAAEFRQKRACCGGLLCCFRACFARASSNWGSENVVRERLTQRLIRIGLLMPPWGEKTNAEVHLHPAFSVALATEFLSVLQKHAILIQS